MNTLILTPEAMFQGDLLLVNPSFPHHPSPIRTWSQWRTRTFSWSAGPPRP